MKLKRLSVIALATLGLSLFSSSTFAAGDSPVVAKVISQNNQVMAENSEGARRLLTVGSEVLDNEYVIVLENASVQLQYASSQCKVTHGANELVTISEVNQCGAGQKIAVGQGTASIGTINAAGNGGAGSTIKASLGLQASTLASVLPIVGFVGITTIAVADDGNGSK